MEAARQLLERDGVLAGLNMQEVADTAGVNRGLIHHYFGSRRDLLRASLEVGLRDALPVHELRRRLPPDERGVRQFRDHVTDPRYARLLTLLALDGDDSLRPFPFLEDRVADMERERDDGYFADDLDVAAFITTWDATLIGYALLREAAARQLGVSCRELDRRVLAMLDRETSVIRKRPRSRSANGQRQRS